MINLEKWLKRKPSVFYLSGLGYKAKLGDKLDEKRLENHFSLRVNKMSVITLD